MANVQALRPASAPPVGYHASDVGHAGHILIIDDDASVLSMLERYLTKQGYRVSVAADSESMRRRMRTRSFDLVILDLMLGHEDGLVLARDIRSGSDVPIIMLTAKGDEIDRIIGLEMGADDYIGKPFNPREVLARMKSVLRRCGPARKPDDDGAPAGEVAGFAGWHLLIAKREVVSPENKRVELTSGEFDLLSAFVTHSRRVLSREMLLDYARGGNSFSFDRSIDIQVMRLRRKIEVNAKDPAFIKTVRGSGYIFTPAVEWR